MFDFTIKHVPAEQHKGPDALSRRPLGEGENIEEDDGQEWLDNVALYIGATPIEAQETFKSLARTNGPPDGQVYTVPGTTQDLVSSGKWEKCFFSFLAAFGAFPKHISI